MSVSSKPLFAERVAPSNSNKGALGSLTVTFNGNCRFAFGDFAQFSEEVCAYKVCEKIRGKMNFLFEISQF